MKKETIYEIAIGITIIFFIAILLATMIVNRIDVDKLKLEYKTQMKDLKKEMKEDMGMGMMIMRMRMDEAIQDNNKLIETQLHTDTIILEGK